MIQEFKIFIKREIENTRTKALFRRSGSLLINPYLCSNSRYIQVGKAVKIKDFARIECYDNFHGIKLEPYLEIEDDVIINNNFTCFVANTVHIGKKSILANNVMIASENHGMNPESNLPYHAQPLITKPTSIGENCWIGANVSILCGVNIGNNCIVGANSVVNKSFPDYCIIAGNPGKIIKKYNFISHCWERC